MNLHQVIEPERLFVIAFGMDTGPAELGIGFGHVHGKTERTVEAMLGGFHETEKIGVMHDAGHVGVRKLDPPRNFEFVWHDFLSLGWNALATLKHSLCHPMHAKLVGC